MTSARKQDGTRVQIFLIGFVRGMLYKVRTRYFSLDAAIQPPTAPLSTLEIPTTTTRTIAVVLRSGYSRFHCNSSSANRRDVSKLFLVSGGGWLSLYPRWTGTMLWNACQNDRSSKFLPVSLLSNLTRTSRHEFKAWSDLTLCNVTRTYNLQVAGINIRCFQFYFFNPSL